MKVFELTPFGDAFANRVIAQGGDSRAKVVVRATEQRTDAIGLTRRWYRISCGIQGQAAI